MGIVIGTNAAALGINRHLAHTSDELSKSYQRLASGQRIVTAGDDAAGLAISENLRTQVRSIGQAQRNASDGTSFAQVAEGGLTEISNMLVRLRELGIEGASDTIGDRERSLIHQEGQSLLQEIDRLANVTNYNGIPLLNAQAPKEKLDFQVGIHNTENDRITFDATSADVRTNTLGIDGLNYESIDNSREVIDKVDEAMNRVSGARATLGAMQNKLQTTVRNLDVYKENMTEAMGRIADTDIANETTNLVRANILQQAGVSVLAQANSAPSLALKLL